MSFTELKNTLSSEHETAMILKYLQQVAVLVQGNWIINSELIYPKDTKSHQNGIPAELMCRARDFVVSTSILNIKFLIIENWKKVDLEKCKLN